ncbi:hypothetical protein KDX10_13600 [Burkholderia cenocepacia]|uniref:hypothetical protein n=2 Tax=Burkholderia TaxID=32008 RepID=UPI00158ECA29|nr:hypothetical protein [Burkholderia cenocepacia]MBN3567181.1 hypothetical protein [Burkholderia cenocepacia]MBR7955732.1 hypothetical protein [Burkholderia cenocepacia]MBR8110643.1 hypothetical protein [Burkholderia cenocepacia]
MENQAMSECFDISVTLERSVSLAERQEIVFSLAKICTPFFDAFHEVSVLDFKTGLEVRKEWADGEGLAGLRAGEDELLFVYGAKSTQFTGARGCMRIEERDWGAQFSISLPLSADADSFRLESLLVDIKDYAARQSPMFIVAAGWELDCDIDAGIDGMVKDALSDGSLCQWLATPAPIVPDRPNDWQETNESGEITLLKRKSV